MKTFLKFLGITALALLSPFQACVLMFTCDECR
jgi:hypothetical protein